MLPMSMAHAQQPMLGTMAIMSHPEFRGGYIMGPQGSFMNPGMVMLQHPPTMAMMHPGMSPAASARAQVDEADIPDLDNILDGAEHVELEDEDIPEEPEGEAPSHAFWASQ